MKPILMAKLQSIQKYLSEINFRAMPLSTRTRHPVVSVFLQCHTSSNQELSTYQISCQKLRAFLPSTPISCLLVPIFNAIWPLTTTNPQPNFRWITRSKHTQKVFHSHIIIPCGHLHYHPLTHQNQPTYHISSQSSKQTAQYDERWFPFSLTCVLSLRPTHVQNFMNSQHFELENGHCFRGMPPRHHTEAVPWENHDLQCVSFVDLWIVMDDLWVVISDSGLSFENTYRIPGNSFILLNLEFLLCGVNIYYLYVC